MEKNKKQDLINWKKHSIKNIHITIIWIVLMFGINAFPIYSQILEKPNLAMSPNAASLGLYGEVPISLYTGTPQITVPLYEIKVHDFTMPISLNYHTATRPDQHPGWTGLGWNLEAGGCITRKVNKFPDDENVRNSKRGFYYTYETVANSSWNKRDYLREVAQGAWFDTEPDEFSFRFGEYQGSFYLGYDGKWKVQSDQAVQVELKGQLLDCPFEQQEQPFYASFGGFTITTGDGVQYVFGGTTDAIEYSMDFFQQSHDYWIATSWYLTKIILPTNYTIEFSYNRGDFINQMYISVNFEMMAYTETSSGKFAVEPSCWTWGSGPGRDEIYAGNLIAPVYLNRISTPFGNVNFEKTVTNELRYDRTAYDANHRAWIERWSQETHYPPLYAYLHSNRYGPVECLDNLKWYQLDKMSITDTNNKEIKQFNFNYTSNSNLRLMLLSVSEGSGWRYTFDYLETEKMPPYVANKTDHWGYFNNKTATHSSPGYYYNYKEPAPGLSHYGVLNKITYPTGGYTLFDYENHYYRKQLSVKRWERCEDLNTNKLAGGLRIKRILNSESGKKADEVEFKRYFYVTDYLQKGDEANISSGVMGGQFQYFYTDYTVYSYNNSNMRKIIEKFSSQSVLPGCTNAKSSPIGYTEVIEKNADNSFTRYTFTNFDNGNMDEKPDAVIQESATPYSPYNSKEMERGLLRSKEDYHANGKLVRKETIQYEKNNSNEYIRLMKGSAHFLCLGSGVAYDEGTSYRIYTYLMRPKLRTEILYDPLTGVQLQSTNYNYTYNTYKLLKTETTTNSKGESIENVYNYLMDYPNNSKAYNRYLVNPIYEKITILNKGGSKYIVNAEKYEYGFDNYDHFVLKNTYTFQGVNRQITTPHIMNGDSRMVLAGSYIYNSKGLPIQYTNHLDNQMTYTYLWSYKGEHPIAIIENATNSQTEMLLSSLGTSQEALLSKTTSSAYVVNALRSSLPQSYVTTFEYEPMVGIVEQTDPAGFTTYYDYDRFGRLEEIYYRDYRESLKWQDKWAIQGYYYHYRNQPNY